MPATMIRANGLRKTGIGIIGDKPWGTHFCHFFHSKQDLIETLVPYFKAGLESNEKCMWITAEPLLVSDAEESLRAAVPGFDEYLSRGQMEIIPHTEWYLKGGSFDLNRVLQDWVDKLDDALEQGYEGMRVTGSTIWLDTRELFKEFNVYEREVDHVIDKFRLMAICSYSLDRCTASDIIDVVACHEFAMIKREGRWELIESGRLKETNERRERLEAANRDLLSFGYTVAHDLKAPLRAIDGFAHILQEDYAGWLDDEGQRLIGAIRTNSQRMGQLIEDLLSLSRMGSQEMTAEKIDMNRLAREVFAELSVPGRAINFELHDLPAAHGDPPMIARVLANLLGNAIKFTRSREIATIEVGSQKEDEENIYYVRDNGIGFDMKYAHKLFKVFERLCGAHEFEGTGVGLAIVKRIVDRHGGQVWAEGREDGGATFYFTLASPEGKDGD